MKKLIVATLLALSSVGSASAADMAVKAKPMAAPVAPVWNWTGFYVGVNLGGAWGDNSRDYALGLPAGSGTAILTNCGSAAGQPPLAIAGINPFNLSSSCRSDSTSFIGGGQIGYNWQAGSWLFGVEADGAWQELIERSFVQFGSNGAPGQPFGTVAGDTAYFRSETNSLGTFRGRVGFTGGAWLLYATGGAAVANVKHSFTEVLAPGNSCPTIAGGAACRSVSSDSTKWGWTVGGGVEWMFAPNWSVGAEYLYVDLGTTTLSLVPNGNIFFPSTSTVSFDDREHVARVKLNYHFGGFGKTPVVAKY